MGWSELGNILLLPPHEVYYAQILYDKERTACLNRNNFPLHTAAAVAANSSMDPKMGPTNAEKHPQQQDTSQYSIPASFRNGHCLHRAARNGITHSIRQLYQSVSKVSVLIFLWTNWQSGISLRYISA